MKKIFLFLFIFVLTNHIQAQTRLSFDKKSSEVTWKGGKKLVNDSHNGTIGLDKGELRLNKNGEVQGGFISIDMKSIKNNDVENPKYKKKLENHLKSADFFDVKSYPTAKFEIKKVKSLDKDKESKKSKNNASMSYQLTGDLSIKGKKKPMKIDINIKKVSKKKYSVEGDFEFDRTLWDVRYGSDKFFKSLGDKVIKDQIQIGFKLFAKAK